MDNSTSFPKNGSLKFRKLEVKTSGKRTLIILI